MNKGKTSKMLERMKKLKAENAFLRNNLSVPASGWPTVARKLAAMNPFYVMAERCHRKETIRKE